MPYRPEVRKYRSFAASNFQPVVREKQLDEDGNDITPDEPSYKVRGYWTTWGEEYCLYERSEYWPAEFEQVDRHALDQTDLSDVIFQENHEGSPLARIRNGSLVLGTDEHGAWCEADLGGCQRGREIYESICNGLIVEMSFGFIVGDEDSDGYTTFKDEDGDYHTTLTNIRKVFDVSCVNFGANPFTDISELRQRSAAAAAIEADRKAAEEAERLEQERIEAEKADEEKTLMERIEAQRSRRKRRARALGMI